MRKNVILKKTLVIGIIILFFGAVFIPIISSNSYQLKINNTPKTTSSFNPFKEGWKYRKKITIDNSKVTGNLASFPVLISVADTDLRDKAQIDGDDILFMNNKGEAEPLFHEIESYDSSTGILIAWVNIPILYSAVDVVFYMYYGNLNCANQEFPEMVWDSNYCGVWHLNDYHDSTINGNDGGNHGTDDCSGKIGNAKDFVENNNDYIGLGDMPEPADDITSKATFEVWINPEIGVWRPIICKQDTALEPDRRSYKFELLDSGQIRFSVQSGIYYPSGNIIRFTTNDNLVTSGTWQHVVAVVDLSQREDTVFYYNGEEKTSTIEILGTPPTHFYDIDLDERLGKLAQESATKYYDGSMDEVRISKTSRSAEWFSTQYNNQNDVLNFLTIGPEETKQKSYAKILLLNFFDHYPNLFPIIRFLLNL